MLSMPFVAAFMTMHFFLLHAQEWRDKKHYLGPREWSPVARRSRGARSLLSRSARAAKDSAILAKGCTLLSRRKGPV